MSYERTPICLTNILVVFFQLSKCLEEMRFRVIRYKFDRFSDHDFCYLQLWRRLMAVVFAERRTRFEGGFLGWDHSQSL